VLLNRTRAALLLAALAATGAAPVPAERRKLDRELAERGIRLHGSWIGGPCQGRITFRADGTYEWTGRGPGGDTDTGTWAVRGTPSAPVLVLACKTSDDEDRTGTLLELRVTHLGATGFTIESPEAKKPIEFLRAMNPPRNP
jgi:hypothetical protein